MNIIISNQVDESDRDSLLAEVARLRASLSNYNTHEIPSPTHIKRDEYASRDEYRAAKDVYFKTYKREFTTIQDEMKRCENLITDLARTKVEEDFKKQKEAGVIIYSADEKQRLKEDEEFKSLSQSQANAKYYQTKGKQRLVRIEQLKHKRKMEKIEKQASIKFGDKANRDLYKHLIKTKEIIKPLCLCGKKCGVIDFADMKAHSIVKKHQLFKSIINWIHYERKSKNIKKVVGVINEEAKKFKRVVRVKNDDGVSFTRTCKSEKEIIEYYTVTGPPMNEDLYPPLRTPYIERVKYTDVYKLFIWDLKGREVYLKNK